MQSTTEAIVALIWYRDQGESDWPDFALHTKFNVGAEKFGKFGKIDGKSAGATPNH